MQIHVLMQAICRSDCTVNTVNTTVSIQTGLGSCDSTANSSPLIFTKYINFSSFSFQLYWLLSQTLTYHKHLHDKMSNIQPCNDSHTKTQDTVLFLCSVTLTVQWACYHCQQNAWQYTGCSFSCVSEYGSCITQKVCIHREFRAIRQVKLQGKSEL